MRITVAAVGVAIALALWIDVVGYVQSVLWLRNRLGTPKALIFSATLRWHFLPPWPQASAIMPSALLDTSDIYAFGSLSLTRGFLFVPGALVHPHAYALILNDISAATGVLCVCVKPRFRHPARWASTDEHALAVMQRFPNVQAWTVGGHSMGAGGFGAALLASRLRRIHTASVDGLIMWAGAITNSTGVDLSDDATLRSLVILASEDSVVPPEGKAEDGSLIRDNLRRYSPPNTKLVVINGGNHGGFGHYVS